MCSTAADTNLLPLPLKPHEVYGNSPDRLVSVCRYCGSEYAHRQSESHPGTCQGELSIRSDLVAPGSGRSANRDCRWPRMMSVIFSRVHQGHGMISSPIGRFSRSSQGIGLSLLGAGLVTTAAILALLSQVRGHVTNPYIGMLLFVVLPIVLWQAGLDSDRCLFVSMESPR